MGVCLLAFLEVVAFFLEFGGHFSGADDGEADVLGFSVESSAGGLGFLVVFGLPEVVDDDEGVILIGFLGFIVHVI